MYMKYEITNYKSSLVPSTTKHVPFFYLCSSAHVPLNRRRLLQAHSGGVQVSIFPELSPVFLTFRDYAPINDGQWHHVAIVWNSKTASLTLVTEGLIAGKVEDYGLNRTLPH